LVLALQTDVSVPKDVDSLRIEISHHGDIKWAQTFWIGTAPNEQPLPATLTILPPDDNGPVRVRVLSYKEGIARTLRRVVTTIPTDREAMLRMPIEWLCYDQVEEGDTTSPRSSCPDGETCSAGTCVPDEVDSAKLPSFAQAHVFGGPQANADGKGGSCFETIECLAESQTLAPEDLDPETCSVPLSAFGLEADDEAGIAKLNLAFATGPGGGGICDDAEELCFVPVDQDDTTGWSVDGDVVRLPPGVCTKLADKPTVDFVYSTVCRTKTSAVPSCGPWTEVDGSVIGVGDPDGSGGTTGSGGTSSSGGGGSTGNGGSDSGGPGSGGGEPTTTGGTSASGGTSGDGGTSGSGGTGGSVSTVTGPEVYVSFTTGHGNAWTASTADSSIEDLSTDRAPVDPLCTTGLLAGNTSAYALVAMNLNQETGSSTIDTFAPTNEGLWVDVTNDTFDLPLRVQIRPAAAPQEVYCANLPPQSGSMFIAWTDFNDHCTDNLGNSYDWQALSSLEVVVLGDQPDDTSFSFCLNDLAEGSISPN
jgi:hypothetical protein